MVVAISEIFTRKNGHETRGMRPLSLESSQRCQVLVKIFQVLRMLENAAVLEKPIELKARQPE